MNRLRHLLLLPLLAAGPAALAGPPTGLATPVQAQNFTTQGWRGGPVTDDTGRAQACAMFAPAEGGMELFFRLSAAFDFSLGLVNRRWNLNLNTALPMTYRIDGSAPIVVQARVTRSDTVLLDISDRESIFQAFRRGLWLYLSAQGANGRFSLKGTSVALEQLRVCATTLANAQPTEPDAPPPTPPPGK